MAAAVHNLESQLVTVRFVLQLYDAVTNLPKLQGSVNVAVAGQEVPMEKADRARFVFLLLPPGAYTFQVRSDEGTPFYLPADIDVTLPMSSPLWPSFPDRALADPTLPLDDPGQTAAYRTQRDSASLMPSAAYPFSEGASLVRGTIRVGAAPLAGAHVSRLGDPREYLTGEDGQYVLWFTDVDGMGEPATIQATHAAHLTVSDSVTLRRGLTVVKDLTTV